MRVLHIAAECYPLLKTGGLADVVGALPQAQRALGSDARVLLPGFPAVRAGLQDAKLAASLPVRFGSDTLTLWQGRLPSGVPAYVIDAPGLYDRTGNPYADADQHPYADNHRRFALLAWVAAQLAEGLLADWRPQLLHGHDWHAGLTPAYLRQIALRDGRRPAASVFTVHNLAYQGVFPATHYAELGLPAEFYRLDGLEFHGQLSFIKAGLQFSDRIATVSPSYAEEIQAAEHGCGLDGLLRYRADALRGILNGVDEQVWDPASDPALPAHFDAERPLGKARCKAALQAELGLAAEPGALLFGVVSRLTEQKGLNLVLAGAEALLAQGGQLLVLGSGEPALEEGFRQLAQRHAGRVAVRLGFDEPLSHRIFAGCDVVLVPSRFEPCGLTQMYGMRYGALPLARRTGGLADTVSDVSLENLAAHTATGLVFERFTQPDFDAAVRRAFALHGKPQLWREVRRQAMQQHFGWEGPARDYLALYKSALG
ncbi:glycogen synthase GlgA [Chitinimonas sp.]|uniref:glycogen synthase GlgA n=1 Tax=Chitinimonas sp. TaxID=1934313 RepID=UPI002F924FB2